MVAHDTYHYLLLLLCKLREGSQTALQCFFNIPTLYYYVVRGETLADAAPQVHSGSLFAQGEANRQTTGGEFVFRG